MKSVQPKKTDELRMSSAEFDRMMRGALQAHHEDAPKPKKTTKPKTKTARKKTT